MKALAALFLLFFHLTAFARTFDCQGGCQEVYETDIQGAERYGIKVNVQTLVNPSLTYLEISEDSKFLCEIGWLEITVGQHQSGRRPEVAIGYKHISDFREVVFKNYLIEGTRLSMAIKCEEASLSAPWKDEKKEKVLSILIK